MRADILRQEVCPHCGAGAIAAESERVRIFEQFGMCEHLHWWTATIWVIRCGLCGFTWPVTASAEQVGEDRVLASTAP